MITPEKKVQPPVQLPQEVCAHIDLWLKKFPAEQKQSAVIEALRAAQTHFNGWLSPEVMQAVADYLEMPAIAVYEVATFYDMFETAPIGKHTIGFCTGVACMLRGVDETVAYVEQKLKVKLGETTADGLITLREYQCLAACDGAPMCQIDHRYYHMNLDRTRVDELIHSLQKDQEPSSSDGGFNE